MFEEVKGGGGCLSLMLTAVGLCIAGLGLALKAVRR
jgi:hypothetical protein